MQGSDSQNDVFQRDFQGAKEYFGDQKSRGEENRECWGWEMYPGKGMGVATFMPKAQTSTAL